VALVAAFFFAGYLCGSVPFGLLLTRLFARVDVRTSGSGNIGATNVTRVAGKKVGALVLLFDAAKGALPVLAALSLYPDADWLHAATGLGAVLGHVFSCWLRFRGGKGVATALGVFLVLLSLQTLLAAVVYVAVFALWRVSSLSSLFAIVTLAASSFFQATIAYRAAAVSLACLLFWTHRDNIRRLMARQENSFRGKR
jgi:acyl phosphate:glycerol-3-phosphate acyltransferase